MANFKYKARNSNGEVVTGDVIAENISEAKDLLSEKSIYVTEIKEKTEGPTFMDFFKPKVKTEDLMIFNGQLETVFSVGVPLMKGLQFIKDQTINPSMKSALEDIILGLSEGLALSTAMSKHPRIFDSTYQSLIIAGEATGELESILNRTSDIITTKMENKAKVKAALFYPKIVVSFLCLVFFANVYFIIPKMSGVYKGMKIELPAITKFMMTLSDILTSPVFLLTGFGLIASAIYFRKYVLDKYLLTIHTWLLKIPIIGKLILEIELNSFCFVLNLLMLNGISLLDGLKIMRGVLNNKKVIQTISHCEEVISEGKSLSYGMKNSEVFPPLLVNFVTIGEESGELDKVLSKMADYYKVRVSNNLDNFSKLIEPILLFVIFGAVLSMALAVFLPMWKMGSGMKR